MKRSASLLALALTFLSSSTAHSHAWYPPECCSENDCRPVPRGEVRVDAAGGLLILIDGDWYAIPPDKIREKPSPDSQIHVCYSRVGKPPHTLFCVFVPASM